MNMEAVNQKVINTKAVIEVTEKVDENIVYKVVKRIVDIIGGIVGGIILIPLTIGVFIVNLFEKDKGPIFYTQNRIGQNGKKFKMYKFRSMVVGADEILEQYLKENEDARIEYKMNKKLKNDPRITKTGKFLRRTSLDEFPQFINVFKGDMSLVGPRPYLPREIEDMGDYYKHIIKSKPGITGYWQVTGRSTTTFQKRLEMDCKYNKEKSLKLDFKLLVKTITNVIKKEGAL